MNAESGFSRSFGPKSSRDIPGPAQAVYGLMPDIAGGALAPAYWPDGESMRPYRFEVGYTEDGRFNAAATDAEPGHGLVAFCFGAPFILFHACVQAAQRADLCTALPEQDSIGRMLVYPDTIPLAPPGMTRNTPSDQIARRCADLLDGGPREGPERARLTFALLLYEMGARFLCMHECMHIILGHTAYVRDQFGMAALPEFFSRSRRKIPPAISQTLEFIADRHAARGVLEHYMRKAHPPSIAVDMAVSSKIPVEVYMARLVTTSIVLVMHLLPTTTSMVDRGSTHPHPYLRMRWICRELNCDLDRESALEGVARPFSHWLVALGSNFRTRNNWLSDSALDQASMREGDGLSDKAYSEIVALARHWQTPLWKQYSPVYENDGRRRDGA